MTLNLMMTSKDAVYLSGDFRLTSIKDRAPLPDSYETQKLVPVIRGKWAALVAYMGVASAPPLIQDVGQWIVEQMDSIPHDASPSELSKRLLRFNAVLDRIRGDRRIAFSLVGFTNQRPFMMLISNFLNFEGTVDSGSRLRGYVRRSTQPEVRAVGTFRPDVFERVKLERLLQAGASPRRVPELTRQAIAQINGAVARRSHHSISEACVSGYLLRSGSAVIGGHGIAKDAACLPNWVRRDLDRGGVIGFEPRTTLPVQWTRTVVKIFKGTIVRIHEIANAGKPICSETPRQPHTPAKLPPGLTDMLEAGTQSHFIALPSTTDGAICILKYVQ